MINVGIVGAKGYAGKELIRLCLKHNQIKLIALMDLVNETEPLGDTFPEFIHLKHLLIEPANTEKLISQTNAVFLALPHKAAQSYAGILVRNGIRVIDLSADFRFKDLALYEKTYNVEHKEKEIARQAIYGLAEINRHSIRNAQLISVPGCYPTSILLGLAPLALAGVKMTPPIIADSKSGVSGAGRKPTDNTHFPECNESLQPYSIGKHRHQPEIEEKLREMSGIDDRDLKVIFTPHLIPMNRGILSTIYIKLTEDISFQKLQEIYQEQYGKETFIRLLPEGRYPATKNVVNTNFCDIYLQKVDAHLLLVITAIDNLIKGAAGQALQCFNICYNFPEHTGLF
ncbi:MAG: N-acetyl-gamma-glutamyl-phosphate reductase [Candidatus Sumerlaeia bacterium]|nr:N-acetyl-gamma-glutamyl-phosphate reductase [Candidatus Sumerlaeia bacterium]